MQLVGEVNGLVGQYRWLAQWLGTGSDGAGLRGELAALRVSVLKACDTTKNCVLPQLKWEGGSGGGGGGGGDGGGEGGASEFTKQASQFIGCLSLLAAELRRSWSLQTHFPLDEGAAGGGVSGAGGGGSGPGGSGPGGSGQSCSGEAEALREVEAMLETLENLITVHFSTMESEGEPVPPPRQRRKGCRSFANICSNLKTNYA